MRSYVRHRALTGDDHWLKTILVEYPGIGKVPCLEVMLSAFDVNEIVKALGACDLRDAFQKWNDQHNPRVSTGVSEAKK